MKKLLAIILFMCMLTLSACTNASKNENESKNENTTSSKVDKEPVKSIDVSEDEMLYTGTYDRLGEYISFLSCNELFSSFLDASKSYDLTVKVSILAFVSCEVDSFCTVFLAQILDVYKGDVSKNDKIFLLQYGDGKNETADGFPIFNISDTFLLNLKDKHVLMVNGQSAYSIANINLGIIQLYNYKNTEYAIERCVPGFLDELNLTPIKEDEANEVWDDLIKNDPIMENAGHGKMYKYSDLEEQIRSIV